MIPPLSEKLAQLPPQVVRCSFPQARELVKIGVEQLNRFDYRPDILIAISGGGLIPARLLRTELGAPTIPIYIVGAASYLTEHGFKQEQSIKIYQWLEEDILEKWRHERPKILIVDDIFDTGKTVDAVERRLHEDVGIHAAEFFLHYKTSNKEDMNIPIVRIGIPGNLETVAGEGICSKSWMVYEWEERLR